jgi:hypothetical protein
MKTINIHMHSNIWSRRNSINQRESGMFILNSGTVEG